MKRILFMTLASMLSLSAMNGPLRFESLRIEPCTTCPGTPNGKITVNIAGGTAPYDYQIGFIINEQGSIQNNLFEDVSATTMTAANIIGGAGIVHRIVVQDAAGNNISAAVQMQNEPLFAEITEVIIQNRTSPCEANGSITLKADSEIPVGFSLLGDFSDGQTTGLQEKTFGGLVAKAYSFGLFNPTEPNVVLWEGGVEIVNNIQPDTLAISVKTTQANQLTGQGGTITITATGGQPPYRFSIDNGQTFQTSNVFTNLKPGTYPIRVEDANNCFRTATATIVAVCVPRSTNPLGGFIEAKQCCPPTNS